MAKSDKGAGKLVNPDGKATCDNPLCGDRVTIEIKSDAGQFKEIVQTTRGCLLTKAAASAVVDLLHGQQIADAKKYRDQLRDYLQGKSDRPPHQEIGMFEPVRDVKSRHDCILIAFDALVEAAENADQS